MVQIRSTQKLAISPEEGLCDITRKIVKYGDYEKHGKLIIRIDVIDEFIQEKVINGVIERKVILTKPVEDFYFSGDEVDNFFTSMGTDILTSGSHTGQISDNRESILIARTVAASDTGYHGMTTWVADSGDYKIVKEFSE